MADYPKTCLGGVPAPTAERLTRSLALLTRPLSHSGGDGLAASERRSSDGGQRLTLRNVTKQKLQGMSDMNMLCKVSDMNMLCKVSDLIMMCKVSDLNTMYLNMYLNTMEPRVEGRGVLDLSVRVS